MQWRCILGRGKRGRPIDTENNQRAEGGRDRRSLLWLAVWVSRLTERVGDRASRVCSSPFLDVLFSSLEWLGSVCGRSDAREPDPNSEGNKKAKRTPTQEHHHTVFNFFFGLVSLIAGGSLPSLLRAPFPFSPAQSANLLPPRRCF